MNYFGVSTRNGVGLGLGTVPSLTNTPLGYRLAPSLNLSFAGSDTLDPRITFSRTTNATLTNSAGLVANAPMNLLTFSEQFDNAVWSKPTSTITANTTAAPNGTVTADTIAATTTGINRETGQSFTSTAGSTYTFSVYLKAGSTSWCYLIFSDRTANSNGFYFDVINGQVGGVTGLAAGSTVTRVSSSVTAASNGFFRCQIVCTISNSASYFATVGVANADNSTTATGGITAISWGAQLELGSTATTYNPTTVKNLLGFTENFDNAAWTKSNAFVQTNLLTYSQDFENAVWGKTNATVTANSTTAPDGTLTADTAVATASGGSVQRTAITFSAAGAYTVSVYAKKGSTNTFRFRFRDATATTDLASITFDVDAGTITQTAVGSGVITSVGDGWYRCSITGTVATAANSHTVFIYPNNVSGAVDGDSVFIWGAQLVQGTSAGDYKATYAAAAAVGYTDIYGQPFAQKLVEDAASSQHVVLQTATTSGTPVTFSAYIKAAERSQAHLRNGNAGVSSFFDLSTGTVISQGSGQTASIVSIGDGWYRCAIVLTATTGVQQCLVGSASGGTNFYTGDGTSGIYIFGAQLSDSASVDPYVYQPVAAPSSVAYYGPRFDYDPVTLAPKGLLIEEQRTNLFTYSEQFDNAAWTKVLSTSVTPNSAISPDGTTNADLLTFTSQFGCIQQSATLTSGTQYTISFWAKVNSGSNTYSVYNNTSGVSLGTVTPTGAWVRYAFTFTAAATGVAVFNLIQDRNASGFGSVFIWGAQLEAGAFATSYIPTVASQVTRAADNASMIGNNFARWYNVNAGSLFTQFQLLSGNVTSSNTNIAAFEGAGGLNMTLHRDGGSQAWRYRTNLANLNVTGVSDTASNKTVFAYATSDYPFVVAGGTVQLNTGVGAPPVTTSFVIGGGSNYALARQINGTIARIAYYNRRLSNTELRGITS